MNLSLLSIIIYVIMVVYKYRTSEKNNKIYFA